MNTSPATYDVVALVTDMPEYSLVKGQVGTVVMELAPEQVEVEFVDEKGKTYGLASISTKHLMRLHYHRVQAA
jgi:hypothetical protein